MNPLDIGKSVSSNLKSYRENYESLIAKAQKISDVAAQILAVMDLDMSKYPAFMEFTDSKDRIEARLVNIMQAEMDEADGIVHKLKEILRAVEKIVSTSSRSEVNFDTLYFTESVMLLEQHMTDELAVIEDIVHFRPLKLVGADQRSIVLRLCDLPTSLCLASDLASLKLFANSSTLQYFSVIAQT